MSEVPVGIPPELVERFRIDRLPFHQRGARLDELLSLAGQRALVTGGGGLGLGQACCHRLAALGADVAILDTNGESAAAVAAAVRDRWSVRAEVVVGSVDSWEATERAVRETSERLGGLEILVNNAGGVFGSQFGAFARISKKSIDVLVDRNLRGTIYCTHAALGVMLPARRGRIINIASEGAKVGLRNIGLYNACKAGVIGFTRNLAHEVGDLGVSPVAVCPGVMMHDGLLQLLRKRDAAPATASIELGFARSTIGRASLPEEVANMVAFLASEAGSFVHGTAVSVGGGLSD